jgi:ABC-2 type transport system ATP-binding protein
LADTPILLLDEPAAGLDVTARSELLRIVREIVSEGKTVIITSHILPELEQLADRFIIMENGQWVKVQQDAVVFSRNDLESGFGSNLWEVECSNAAIARRALPADATLEGPRPATLLIKAADKDEAARHLAGIIAAGVSVYGFKLTGNTLTDMALKVLNAPPPPPTPPQN